MNLNFSVDMVNMDLEPEKYKEKARKVLWLSMHKMMELAKKRAPVDTGLLRRSITLTPAHMGASTYILADGVNYGSHLEFGTSPHFPPVKPLNLWARRVLGNEQLGYAVAKSISIRGTPAHPFFRPAKLEVETIWLKAYWDRVMAEA